MVLRHLAQQLSSSATRSHAHHHAIGRRSGLMLVCAAAAFELMAGCQGDGRDASASDNRVALNVDALKGGQAGGDSQEQNPTARTENRLIVMPGFEEPLLQTGPTSAAEDRAIDHARAEYRRLSAAQVEDERVIAPFEHFVSKYPDSGWSSSVQLNLGLVYYQAGLFSLALRAFEASWRIGFDATEPFAKAQVDRAIGEYAQMHARVGHAADLEALFREIGGRQMVGPATELMVGAREGAWAMRHDSGNAFLCGPKALARTLITLGASPEAIAAADNARSGDHGFTLREVADLADASGLPHRLIFRGAGQKIPVPSVINWKVDHYAAIVGEANGRYHVVDPTFGNDLHLLRETIESESTAEGSPRFA